MDQGQALILQYQPEKTKREVQKVEFQDGANIMLITLDSYKADEQFILES